MDRNMALLVPVLDTPKQFQLYIRLWQHILLISDTLMMDRSLHRHQKVGMDRNIIRYNSVTVFLHLLQQQITEFGNSQLICRINFVEILLTYQNEKNGTECETVIHI